MVHCNRIAHALCVLLFRWDPVATHAVAGAFHPPDLAQDVAAGLAIVAGFDPYAVGFATWHARVMGVPPEQGSSRTCPLSALCPPSHVTRSRMSRSSPPQRSGSRSRSRYFGALAFLLAEIAADAVGADRRRTTDTGTDVFRTPSGVATGALQISKRDSFRILLAVLMALAWRSLADRQPPRARVYFLASRQR